MTDHFNGTLFRLPLRTEELAKQSLISKDSYTCEQVVEVLISCDLFAYLSKLLHQFGKSALSMLLFLKNLEQIDIYHRSNGVNRQIFSVKLQNVSEDLRWKRVLVNDYAKQVLKLKQPPQSKHILHHSNLPDLRTTFYLDLLEIKGDIPIAASKWLVHNGASACKSMADACILPDTHLVNINIQERLQQVQWSGVATCLSKDVLVEVESEEREETEDSEVAEDRGEETKSEIEGVPSEIEEKKEEDRVTEECDDAAVIEEEAGPSAPEPKLDPGFMERFMEGFNIGEIEVDDPTIERNVPVPASQEVESKVTEDVIEAHKHEEEEKEKKAETSELGKVYCFLPLPILSGMFPPKIFSQKFSYFFPPRTFISFFKVFPFI